MVYPLATWDELKNAQPGQDLGTLPKNIARAGKDVICDVYKNYPEWASSVADPIYGIMQIPALEDLCKNHSRNVTDDVPVQANGGQCPGVYYVFATRFTGLDFGGDQGVPFDTGWSGYGNQGLLGPVSVFTRDSRSGGSYNREIWARGADGFESRVGVIGSKKAIWSGEHRMQAQGSNPGDCGPGPIPPTRVPPVGDIMKPVPIPTKDGPLTVPVVVPVGVFIHPTFQVNIGAINVNFSLGGVYITPQSDRRLPTPRPTEPQPTTPPGRPLPPSRPDAEPTEPDPVETGGGTDLGPVLDELEKVKSYTRRPKTFLQEEPLIGGTSGSVFLNETVRFVKLVVTTTPPNVRSQSGGHAGPDVFYQGWCAFGRGTNYGERIPISYQSNAYPVPPGCDTFSWTLYDGGDCVLSEIDEVDLTECKTYVCG